MDICALGMPSRLLLMEDLPLGEFLSAFSEHYPAAKGQLAFDWLADSARVAVLVYASAPGQPWLAHPRWESLPVANLPSLKQPGLLIMDMDSTLIQMECIDELAALAGKGQEVAAITEAAMQGELDFVQSLTRRVATLKGMDIAMARDLIHNIPVMPGAARLVKTLKAARWQVGVASGGFDMVAEPLKQRLGLDFFTANHLQQTGSRLTGGLTGKIIDAQAKADYLVAQARALGIPLAQTIAMGDGANDLAMLRCAGLGVAYKAKPRVQREADMAFTLFGLDALVDVLRVAARWH